MWFQIRLVTILAAVSCSGFGSTVHDACSRAESCNILTGSVQECSEALDKALEQRTRAEADQLEFEMANCPDNPSCGSFATWFRGLGPEGSAAARRCERLAGCGQLDGSVAQCSTDLAGIFNDGEVRACLAEPSCSGFRSCLEGI